MSAIRKVMDAGKLFFLPKFRAAQLDSFKMPLLPRKEFRDQLRAYSDLLNWAWIIDDGIVETNDGMFMAGWYFRGEDMGSATHAEMASLSARLNMVMRDMFDGRWSIHVDSVRRYTKEYPARGAFPDRTTCVIDAERRALYEAEGVHLQSMYAFTVAWEVPKQGAARAEEWFYKTQTEHEATGTHKDRMLAKFKEMLADFSSQLSGLVQVSRMQAYSAGVDVFGVEQFNCQFLEYLNFCATGFSRPVALGADGSGLDTMLGECSFEPMSGKGFRLGKLYGKAMTITGFPSQSSPAILSVLDSLGFEYRWNTRYWFMDQAQAESVMGTHRRAWQQKKFGFVDQLKGNANARADSDAVDMADDVSAAESELKSNLVNYGMYTSAIIVLDADPLMLEEKFNEVRGAVQGRSFGVIDESLNAGEAFLGTLPGNRYANVRGGPLSTLNLADLLPMTSVWAGFETHPSPYYGKDAPPLAHASTIGSTPFRLSLHVDDVGHSLMLGPTGSGKTTALNFLQAQHFRYPGARVFGFDYKYGSYVLCNAAGGAYYDIGVDGSALSFCPLKRIDSAEDIAWAADWIEVLLVLQGVQASPQMRKEIFNALQSLSTSQHRSMTEYVALVQSEQLREALQFYTMAGPMGRLLDSEHDELGDSRWMCFEMERLSAMGSKSSAPVLMYLFRELELRLDGSPTFVPMDEVWRALENPIFQPKIKEWLKTFRSKNAHLCLASQEPADVLNSPIRDAVLASCPTRLLLANPDAIGVQRELYESALQCNEQELELIATMTRKRHYYYKSPAGRRAFSLGLGPVALAFVGASGKEEIARAQQFVARYGNTWPAEWLRDQGEAAWADYWMNLT